MFGAQLSRYGEQHGGIDTADDSSMLNFDTVSEKVGLLSALRVVHDMQTN